MAVKTGGFAMIWGDAAETAENFPGYETRKKRAGDGILRQMADDRPGIFPVGNVNIVGRGSISGSDVVMRAEFFDEIGFQKQSFNF